MAIPLPFLSLRATSSVSLVSFFRDGGRAATTSRRGGNNGETPSIVLKSRRTNVRPNSSINLQVNQTASIPFPRWPRAFESIFLHPPARLPRPDSLAYIFMPAYAYICTGARVRRVDVYTNVLRCTDGNKEHALKCSRVSLSRLLHTQPPTRGEGFLTRARRRR